MAGPCLLLLLPDWTTADVEWMSRTMRTLGSVEVRNFWIENGSAIGSSHVGNGRPFFWDLRPVGSETAEITDHELVQVRDQFGFEPKYEWMAGAMCSDRTDHELLAALALSVLERCGGAVDFDGELPAHAGRHRCSQVDGQGEARLVVVRAEANASVVHWANAAFLRRWMSDPGFLLIK